eukprot:8609203-Alexandrium_andersonii.AAC.1
MQQTMRAAEAAERSLLTAIFSGNSSGATVSFAYGEVGIRRSARGARFGELPLAPPQAPASEHRVSAFVQIPCRGEG